MQCCCTSTGLHLMRSLHAWIQWGMPCSFSTLRRHTTVTTTAKRWLPRVTLCSWWNYLICFSFHYWVSLSTNNSVLKDYRTSFPPEKANIFAQLLINSKRWTIFGVGDAPTMRSRWLKNHVDLFENYGWCTLVTLPNTVKYNWMKVTASILQFWDFHFWSYTN